MDTPPTMLSQPGSSRSHHHSSKARTKSGSGIKRTPTGKKSSSSSSRPTRRKKHKHHSYGHTKEHHQESKVHRRLEEDLPRLRRNQYFIRHMQVSLEKNAKKGFLSRLTPEQTAFMRRELVTHPREFSSRADLLRFVMKIVKIYDQAFYYGSLEKHIKKIAIYTRQHEMGEYSKAYFDVEDNELHINIDATYDGKPGTTYDFAATIVHEMLHGFYSNFSCQCAFCKKRSKKSVNGRAGDPSSSHGPLFLTAMRHIEWAMEREFGNGRKFDCGIQDSLRLEMRKSRWQPRRDQFERWGVKYFELGDEAVDGWEDLVPNAEEEEEEERFDLLGAWMGERTCVCAVM